MSGKPQRSNQWVSYAAQGGLWAFLRKMIDVLNDMGGEADDQALIEAMNTAWAEIS